MATTLPVPTDPQERVAWVLYQLKLRHKTLRGLAREAGVTYPTLRAALFQPSYPQERTLAAALGLTVPELFPERYDKAGNRLHRVLGEEAIERPPDRHVQKRGVA